MISISNEESGFGYPTIKAEGTPIHPIEMDGWPSETAYNKQLVAYFDYWLTKNFSNLNLQPEYQRYLELKEEGK